MHEKLRKIDLANCKEVAYEMRDGMPGVRYKEETEYEDQGWTPVIRKRKPRRKLVGNLSDKSGESSDEELKLTRGTRSVKYKIVDGMPGLRIQRGNTMASVSWAPIVPSPVASRTRTRNFD